MTPLPRHIAHTGEDDVSLFMASNYYLQGDKCLKKSISGTIQNLHQSNEIQFW